MPTHTEWSGEGGGREGSLKVVIYFMVSNTIREGTKSSNLYILLKKSFLALSYLFD